MKAFQDKQYNLRLMTKVTKPLRTFSIANTFQQ